MTDHSAIDHESHPIAKPAEGPVLTRLLCALPMLLAPACAGPGAPTSTTISASTVSGLVPSGCSTAVVLGLSTQIADEIGCEHPGGLVPFDTTSVTLTSNAVLPYLEADAAADLETVAANNSLEINSAFRTVAQQYLLYRWYQQGRCGITAAATVGNSNHESGRAVDVSNWSSRVSAMRAQGWAHDVPGDVVHFDHTGSPDIRGQDVKAFQTLWNRNHPEDLISTDGSYGPITAARLAQAPATGFAAGASCVQSHAHAQVVAVDGPDHVPPQTRAHYTIALQNGTAADWPETTTLEITGGSSPLYDGSWIGTSVITSLGAPIAAGDTGQVEFDVTTPAASDVLPISQVIAIRDADSGTTYGTVALALTVTPDGTPDTPASPSDDGGDSHDLGEVTGGCSTGGASGGGALAIALGALVLRRRRRG